jgi:hypothetical protein
VTQLIARRVRETGVYCEIDLRLTLADPGVEFVTDVVLTR